MKNRDELLLEAAAYLLELGFTELSDRVMDVWVLRTGFPVLEERPSLHELNERLRSA